MRFRLAHSIATLATSAALTAACSGGSGLAGGGSKAESAKKQEAAGSGAGSGSVAASAKPGENEAEGADEPAMVSGAFLTCGPAGDTAEGLGCVFRKNDGAKLAESPSEPVAVVSLTDGRTVKPPMKAAPTASPWHYHFKIEPSDLPLVSAMELRAKLGGKVFKRKTARMDEAPDAPREPSPSLAKPPLGPVPENPLDPAMMFVTAKTFAPGADFSSVADADKRCEEAAAAAGLSSSSGWVALLFSAERREYDLSLGVTDVARKLLAVDADAFWSRPKLDFAVLTENGAPLAPTAALAWSGFSDATLGEKTTTQELNAATCDNWTSSAPSSSATIGNATEPQSDWLYDDLGDCASKLHLFCITP